MNTNEVIIPCRLSYANIWEPKQVNGTGDPKYSCCLLIKKSDTNALAAIRKAIEAIKTDPASLAKWGGKLPPKLKEPLRDGDEEKDDENYAGCWFINANANADRRPRIIDRACNEVLDQDEVYSGCYAKVINLSQENEPDIWNAIRRNALLENVTVDKKGKIDYADKSVTENTRVSYPIFHIENIVKPVSKAPAAKKVIFLSADAFGVLPPVSILNSEQTKYYFLSGFTAKLAGTERGITEPTPTFSACFGAAFLSLHPTKYGEELVKKMKKAGAKAYLVNTGWNGTGKRISIKDTRGIIDAILDGSIDKAPTKTLPIFDFTIPTELPGVDPKILDPRDTYKNAKDWDVKAEDLANRFVKNFVKFTGNEEGKKLVAAGPKVK